MLLEAEVDADRRQVAFLEGVICEPPQQRGLAY